MTNTAEPIERVGLIAVCMIMPLPLVPIISAVTPLVLGAWELYRKRRDDRIALKGLPESENVSGPVALKRRLDELEESDLEQARLISEFSKTVEALAKTLQAENIRQNRLERLLWIAIGLGAVSGALSLALYLR